jgi:hypothetical protein
MLGAGASASAGCPLMRGFIDRARDYRVQGVFSPVEEIDVRIALDLYNALRVSFSITEEDVENVENILSLADLSKLVGKPPIQNLAQPHLSDHLRRFIDAVITKSVNVPNPLSPAWQGREANGPLIYKQLIRALAYHGSRITVFTTNYDCLVEYACYCMGISFTYNRALADGVEILKLHGSSNWLQCSNVDCERHKEVRVSPIQHRPRGADLDSGYLETVDTNCEKCGSQLTPMVVPPTWAKDVDNHTLRETWSRAVEVL